MWRGSFEEGYSMLKLYRFSNGKKEYWETWEHEGAHTVHYGELGTRGESRQVSGSFFKPAQSVIQKEIDLLVADGFLPIEAEDHLVLLVEYIIDGMGSEEDLEKRHALEDRMNETLGWTGLGACDGGSIGSGTMEVCNFVVDFDVAKKVIEADLAGTKFSNYSRIYQEG
jgi:hypothetical protein